MGANESIITFTYDMFGPATLTYNGTTYYYLRNAQGDIMGISDEEGNQLVAYTYDAWGKPLSITGTMATTLGEANPFRYRGYFYDGETGLYFLQSRYYDPEVDRFISADSQLNTDAEITGYNLFCYGGNNPVNTADPTGHAFMFLPAAIGAVVGAVAGGIIAAKTGKNVWAGIGIGAAAGGLIGLGVGAAVGALLTGSTTASTAAVVAGAKVSITNAATAIGTAVVATKDKISQGVQKAANTVSNVATRLAGGGSKTISNDVIDLPRVGSALKTDAFHAFPDIVDNYAGFATQSSISNGTLYQLQGSLNGTVGRFEWIIQNQQVTHRMFVPGGGINGIPIMP